MAKHGWSKADETDTAAALLKSPQPQPDGTSFIYIGARYKVGKSWCHRRVVVQYAAKTAGELAGWGAKGIITSYAELE
jgi:hypothetical protein